MSCSSFLRLPAVAAFSAVTLSAFAQNLVQDGGFEAAAPGQPSGVFSYPNGTSIDGGLWIVAAGTGYSAAVEVANQFVLSGTRSAYLDGDLRLGQTLTTIPGQTYTISFDAWGFGRPTNFETTFGSSTFALTAPGFTNLPSPGTHFAFTATAVASSTLLTIGGPNVALGLDNVSVQATPEPSTWAALSLGMFMLCRRRPKQRSRA